MKFIFQLAVGNAVAIYLVGWYLVEAGALGDVAFNSVRKWVSGSESRDTRSSRRAPQANSFTRLSGKRLSSSASAVSFATALHPYTLYSTYVHTCIHVRVFCSSYFILASYTSMPRISIVYTYIRLYCEIASIRHIQVTHPCVRRIANLKHGTVTRP